MGNAAWWFLKPILEELLQLIFNGGISATGLYIIGGPFKIAFMIVGGWKMSKIVQTSNNNAFLSGVAKGKEIGRGAVGGAVGDKPKPKQ